MDRNIDIESVGKASAVPTDSVETAAPIAVLFTDKYALFPLMLSVMTIFSISMGVDEMFLTSYTYPVYLFERRLWR